MLKILAILILILALPIIGATNAPVVKFRPITNNPDGPIKHLNGWLSGQYSKATPEANILINDYSRFGAGFDFPASSSFTLNSALYASFGDTTYYTLSAGFKYYFGGSFSASDNINPDGAILKPVISISGGYHLSEKGEANNYTFAHYNLIIPLSSHFSFGGGGYYYDNDDDIYRTKKYYGQLNFHPCRQESGVQYFNSDGTIGTPSFYLTFGGSANGIFGLLDIKIPLNQKNTIVFYAQGERAPAPYVRIATLGARIHFYPGQ